MIKCWVKGEAGTPIKPDSYAWVWNPPTLLHPGSEGWRENLCLSIVQERNCGFALLLLQLTMQPKVYLRGRILLSSTRGLPPNLSEMEVNIAYGLNMNIKETGVFGNQWKAINFPEAQIKFHKWKYGGFWNQHRERTVGAKPRHTPQNSDKEWKQTDFRMCTG